MFHICFCCQIACVCLHFHPIPLERAWNMNRIGHFGDSLPSLPVSHFIFLWFSTCESIFTYFAQFWPVALGEAQTSSSPNWCNVIVSRHLCWDTLQIELLESLQQETAVVEVKLQVFSTASKSCNFIVSRVPTEAVNQSWKDTYDEKGGKKDWNCSERHFCSENICILCGAMLKKRRGTLCVPSPSHLIWFASMQYSTPQLSPVQFLCKGEIY